MTDITRRHLPSKAEVREIMQEMHLLALASLEVDKVLAPGAEFSEEEIDAASDEADKHYARLWEMAENLGVTYDQMTRELAPTMAAMARAAE